MDTTLRDALGGTPPAGSGADASSAPSPAKKKKSKGTSPTQRSLAHMRKLGYVCAVVEKYNHHVKRKQDLYGFIDVLCVKDEDIVGVQSTSGDNVASRVTKISEHENWPLICKAIRVVVHGWRKNVAGRWVLREVEM
jgi:hypothetical protein